MTAMEQIKRIENTSYDCDGHDVNFLLKAFNVMREIAKGHGPAGFPNVDKEFEEQMAGPIKTGPSDSDFKNGRW